MLRFTIKIVILVLLTLCVCSNIHAQKAQPKYPKISSAVVDGAKVFSEVKIIESLRIKKGQTFNTNDLQNRLLQLYEEYKQIGYPFVSIDSLALQYNSDSSLVALEVFINEGLIAKISTILISGIEESWAERLLKTFDSRPGHIFDKFVLQMDIENVLKELENSGYPFAQVTIDNVRFKPLEDEYHVEIDLAIVPGPLINITEIRVTGNKVTKKHVITRETRLKLGEVYNHKQVGRIQTRLAKLEFIDVVEEPTVFINQQGLGGILLGIQEARSSKFDGVLGYNPASADQKGYFTGLLDLSFGNLFGTGRSLQAKWQKRDQNTQELLLYYQEPWLLGFPLTLGGGFEQLIQDTTYIKRDWMIDLGLPLTEDLTAFAHINHSEIHPDSLGSAVFGIPRSRTWNASLGIDYDTRDNRLNPRKGIRYITSLHVGTKKNLGPASIIEAYDLKETVDNKKVLIDLELYAPLFRWQVLSFALHGRQITSTENYVPITDQFRFGGARTLRGYRENQFNGSKVAWANLEYRYLLARRSRVFVFLDSAYYWRRLDSGESVEGYKLGYGFGLRIETGLGIISVDYGLGEGDGILAGKVHVGLINQF